MPAGAVAMSAHVRAGEIVGIAGVSGNGQRSWFEVLAGQREAESGENPVSPEISIMPPRRDAAATGCRYLPEEPAEKTLAVGGMSVADNIAFRGSSDRGGRSQSGRLVVNGAAFRDAATKKDRAIQDQGTRTPDTRRSPALSGGNVQRTVLAPNSGGDVEVLIAANPCFGLDFAA